MPNSSSPGLWNTLLRPEDLPHLRRLAEGELKDRYAELLCRAAYTILQPLGVEERTLRWWMFTNAGYGAPPGFLPDSCSQETPLLGDFSWIMNHLDPVFFSAH